MLSWQFPADVLEDVASHLPLPTLMQFGATSRDCFAIATKLATLHARASFKGIHLHRSGWMRHTTPEWIGLQLAVQPRVMVSGRKENWTELTKPFPFILDSKGPIFVEFRMVLAKAPSATPTVGVIDASISSKVTPQSSRDWSRGRGQDDAFAIAMSPSCCEVFANIVEGSSPKLPGLKSLPCPRGCTSCQCCFKAELNWQSETNKRAKWNPPIQAGLFLENGRLSFWRMFEDGQWHSSGVICENLPPRVLPCVFMCDFIGYADVRFVRMRRCIPRCCIYCDSNYHGTASGWRALS